MNSTPKTDDLLTDEPVLTGSDGLPVFCWRNLFVRGIPAKTRQNPSVSSNPSVTTPKREQNASLHSVDLEPTEPTEPPEKPSAAPPSGAVEVEPEVQPEDIPPGLQGVPGAEFCTSGPMAGLWIRRFAGKNESEFAMIVPTKETMPAYRRYRDSMAARKVEAAPAEAAHQPEDSGTVAAPSLASLIPPGLTSHAMLEASRRVSRGPCRNWPAADRRHLILCMACLDCGIDPAFLEDFEPP